MSGTGATGTAGPTGPSGVDESRTTVRPHVWMTGVHHRMMPVMAQVVVHMRVPAKTETGEKDNRDDEHDPGDDRDPCGDLEEAVGLGRRR